MTDKKPKYDLEGLGKTEINEVIALEHAKGYEQGKLAGLEKFVADAKNSNELSSICGASVLYDVIMWFEEYVEDEKERLKSQLPKNGGEKHGEKV